MVRDGCYFCVGRYRVGLYARLCRAVSMTSAIIWLLSESAASIASSRCQYAIAARYCFCSNEAMPNKPRAVRWCGSAASACSARNRARSLRVRPAARYSACAAKASACASLRHAPPAHHRFARRARTPPLPCSSDPACPIVQIVRALRGAFFDMLDQALHLVRWSILVQALQLPRRSQHPGPRPNVIQPAEHRATSGSKPTPETTGHVLLRRACAAAHPPAGAGARPPAGHHYPLSANSCLRSGTTPDWPGPDLPRHRRVAFLETGKTAAEENQSRAGQQKMRQESFSVSSSRACSRAFSAH